MINNDNQLKKEYEYIFEKDNNGAFIRLIIPANEPFDIPEYKEELNLIGKLPQEYTLDEIIRMKKYAGKLSERIIKGLNNNQ